MRLLCTPHKGLWLYGVCVREVYGVCVLSCMACVCFSCMAWLRLVGSIQLQVSFSREPCKRHYILQTKPIIFKEPTNRSPIVVRAANFKSVSSCKGCTRRCSIQSA